MEQIKINIKATNLELNDQIRSFVEEKTHSIEKFLHLEGDAEALFEVEIAKTNPAQNTGQIYRAEINLVAHGKVIRTESVQDNINLAIEEAVEEMIRRVRKSKEKRTDLMRRGALAFKKLFNRK